MTKNSIKQSVTAEIGFVESTYLVKSNAEGEFLVINELPQSNNPPNFILPENSSSETNANDKN